MRRVAQITRLRPEKREEYLALHREVWPAVQAAIRAANIRNYSIFLHGDILVGYYEYHGEDLAADLAGIAEDAETRRWWTLTDPCQQRWADADAEPGTGPWTDLPEIWHLSEETE
ncbi:L-rhamnose mutarotase [Kitasatospora viridis]|uniref:L-rhamnose mutarotase n=1 Tax=Kitasatospora viridis TaxID=281105 RepID=A0A561TVI0_9ACTN|nr:L-rhamnose mutarotase [Kitasatospora viridis]TWF91114.1 L-rhamnose mutarotase [Kitasatospora viridis]